MAELIRDPVFHVHFENRNVAFANGILRMFYGKHQFDVTLEVEGKQLHAHRHVLSFVSKELKRSFEGHTTFGKITVNWTGSTYDALKDILDYIYHGSIKVYKRDLEAFVATSQYMDISTNLQDLDVQIMNDMLDEVPAEIVWDGWGEDFVEGFQQLYVDEEHFDVKLKISGQELKAHRHVLTACSKYFANLFNCQGLNMNSAVEVLLDDTKCVTYEAMRDILAFIYLGKVKLTELVPFLKAGEELEIYGLLENDALESERPDLTAKSNIIRIFARVQQIEQSKRVDVKEVHLPKPKASLRTVKPKKVAKVRKQASAVPKKLKVEEPAKAAVKARPAKSSKWQVSEQREPSDEEVRAMFVSLMEKSEQQAYQAQDSDNELIFDEDGAEEEEVQYIPLTEEEFEQMGGKPDTYEYEEDVVLDEEDGAVGFSSEQNKQEEEECYVVDETMETTPNVMKRKRHSDCNNNASCSYDLEKSDWQMDHVKEESSDEDYVEDTTMDSTDEYEYDSDNGAAARPVVIYPKDHAKGAAKGCKSSSSNDNAPKMQVKVEKVKGSKVGRPLGIGKNAAPLDEGSLVEANVITTDRGTTALQHNGHRYRRSGKSGGCNRWKCSYQKSKTNCSVYAYSKQIGGIEMVGLPASELHKHPCPNHE